MSALDGATSAISAQKATGVIPDGGGSSVSGSLCEIPELDGLAVISDLHGDYGCLEAILNEVHYEEFLSNAKNKMVFLGDYVDRGSNSVGVLYAVCRLKAEYPESVVLMRGNHEAPSEFPFSSHDFPFQLVERFGESDGRTAYRKALALFKELAVMVTVDSAFLMVHGGLPTEVETVLQDYNTLCARAQRDHLHNSILEEILWNDPRQVDSLSGWETSRRGIGRHFGQEITQRWLKATGTRCVIRGHEPCKGYRIDHEGRVLTLFSSREPYPKFDAAFLSVSWPAIKDLADAKDLVRFIRYPR